MREESNRFREIGRRLVKYAAEEHGFVFNGADVSMTFDSRRDRSHELVVRDERGVMVAYSHTSNLEDIGRDLEEFSLDYFADPEWRGPIEIFERDELWEEL